MLRHLLNSVAITSSNITNSRPLMPSLPTVTSNCHCYDRPI